MDSTPIRKKMCPSCFKVQCICQNSSNAATELGGLRLAALCIGVGAYSWSPRLFNPVRDAEALVEAINKCPECRAAIVQDPKDRSTILNDVKEFLKNLMALPADKLPEVVILFLAGHAMQHDSNVFLIPAKAKCDDELDLEDKCMSHTRLLEYLRILLDARARDANPPKGVKFLLIMDMCRVEGDFALTNTIIDPDQNKAPRCWSICYSTSRGCVAADGAKGSHSPLVLGLLDQKYGIFAPGVSLEDGIKHACKEVEKLSAVDMRQSPTDIKLYNLGDFTLNPAAEQSRPCDNATSQLEIIAFLMEKGFSRIAERVSKDLGLEEIDDLQYVIKTEALNKLDWLKDVQKEKLLNLCREVTARLMSAHDSDVSADETLSHEATTPLARSVGRPDCKCFESDGENVLVVGRNVGDCADFQEHMRRFIQNFREWHWLVDINAGQETYDMPLGDAKRSKWTICMLLWIGFAHSKDAMLDKSLRDKWFEVTKKPDQAIFLSTFTECLMHPATTHPLWTLPDFKSCKCQKDNAAGIFFTDRVVQYALRGNEKSKERWKNDVVKDWFEPKTADAATDFLFRANRFLREDLEGSMKGMSIFESVVETQSYVVFMKMSGLAASLFFGYLEARKLDFASTGDAADDCRTLPHGFTSFVSSEGHVFSLSKTGMTLRVMQVSHVIVEGLQCLVHLAHTCWDMMGPVKTVQEFILPDDRAIVKKMITQTMPDFELVIVVRTSSGSFVVPVGEGSHLSVSTVKAKIKSVAGYDARWQRLFNECGHEFGWTFCVQKDEAKHDDKGDYEAPPKHQLFIKRYGKEQALTNGRVMACIQRVDDVTREAQLAEALSLSRAIPRIQAVGKAIALRSRFRQALVAITLQASVRRTCRRTQWCAAMHDCRVLLQRAAARLGYVKKCGATHQLMVLLQRAAARRRYLLKWVGAVCLQGSQRRGRDCRRFRQALVAITLQASVRRTCRRTQWCAAMHHCRALLQRAAARLRYVQKLRRACDEQRLLKEKLLRVREQRLCNDCIAAYDDLRACLDKGAGIEYAAACDSIACEMLKDVEHLHSAEKHLATLQDNVLAESQKDSEAETVRKMQQERKETWQKFLDLTHRLKDLSAQATDLRSRFNANAPSAFAVLLAASDDAQQEAQDDARAGGVGGEGLEVGLVDMERVRVLMQKAREHIEQWHEAANRERERLGRITEEAAAALGQEHLDGSVAAAPATVVDVLEAVETEGCWLEVGWWQGYYLCQKRVHAASSKLFVLLQHLQDILDTCCDEAREAEAKMVGVVEAIADPHKLLLEKFKSIRSDMKKHERALKLAKLDKDRLELVDVDEEGFGKDRELAFAMATHVRLSKGPAKELLPELVRHIVAMADETGARMYKAEAQIDSSRRDLQKCLREFRNHLVHASRLAGSLFPELPFCLKRAHLLGDAAKGDAALCRMCFAQDLFIYEPEVAALFASDRDLSHYTNVKPLSRTPQSRHDVDRASFDGQHVALKKYNLHSNDLLDSTRTLRQELAVLARLKHPNIIPVRLFFEEKGAAYVEFPLYDCDMEAWLHQEEGPAYPDVHAAAHDILRAIEHMHRAGVVHCDIRPKNVFMKQRQVLGEGHQVMGKWQAVMGDFDVSLNSKARATIWTTQASTTGARRGFEGELTMAPEVRLQNKACTFASDMYSYGGLLCVALYVAVSPLTSKDGGIEVSEHANVDVAPLVRRLLHQEPKERPSASEALAYPLFAAAGANLLAKVLDQQREVERLRQEHHTEEQKARAELEQKRRALAEDKRKVQEQLREEEAKLQHQSAKLKEKDRDQQAREKSLRAELERVRKEEAQVKRQQAKAEEEANKRIIQLHDKENEVWRERQQLEHDRFARPEHWTPSAGPATAGGGFRLVPLQDDSVLSCLQEHLSGNGIGDGGRDQQVPVRYSHLKLARAWRVENNDLYGQYKVAQHRVLSFVARVPLRGDRKARIRAELYNSSKKLAWRMEEGCNEVRLLHGTQPAHVMSILQNGVNERFAGASKGTKFGDGSYFADDAGKIDQYVGLDQQYDGSSSLHKRLYSTSHSHPGHVFYALVFRVTLGHSVHYADKQEQSFQIIRKSMPDGTIKTIPIRRELCYIPDTDPPTPFHSLVAEGERVKLRYNEYIVFHSDLTYPEYLLAYKRV